MTGAYSMRSLSGFRVLSSVALLLAASAMTAAAAEALIPYEKFNLDNGLTVIVHTDRKAPIVAVNVWYHVGSKNERPGKTGFAHLFEHLMFQGSEHYNDEYFKPFEEVGATSQNGTTSFDRTNYFQNVPTTALDMALWMESDRMGHLLGVIDQARLDEQRGVVQNEKRQGENKPYGRVWETVFRASYPAGHPYGWLPIGSMEDLNAATLDDVREWFGTYYGAANAVLVLAGDIDAATARDKVQKYFGDIAPGPALTRPGVWVAARSESTREIMYDQVAQPRIYQFWNTSQVGTADDELLTLAGEVLGGGKTSRLYERLVYREQIADSVSASQSGMEIGGMFGVVANVKSGVEPSRVETVIAEELRRLIADGPTEAELERARTSIRSGFIRGLERIGGFGGKADVLASCEVFEGDPGCYERSLSVIERATPAEVRAAAQRWLARGDYTLTVLPQPPYHGSSSGGVDRKAGVPVTSEFPDTAFPELERARLANGIPVVIARRPAVPVVQMSLVFDAGYAADQGRKPGSASFTMSMLDEGTKKFDSLAIARRADELGASVSAGSSLDSSFVTLSALSERLDASMALLADVTRNPEFPQAEIDRVKKQWIAGIAQEKTVPDAVALRLLPPLIYGDGHPYAIPLTGSGTEASIAALTREDLQSFHRDWIRPDNLTIVVAGDASSEQVLPLLEKHFGDWRPPTAARPTKTMPSATRPDTTRVYLIDRPGAQQSNIIVGQVTAPSSAPDALQMATMNQIIGGSFTSRINLNLREDKHWTYGARSSLPETRGERPWLLTAPVQTDKTAEAALEIQREIREYVGNRPATSAEIETVKNRDVRALPGRFETNAAVTSAVTDMIVFERPDDYVVTLKDRIEAQTDESVRAAARTTLQPGQMTWVIVGDLAKIEQPIRALSLGEVQVLDADGNRLR